MGFRRPLLTLLLSLPILTFRTSVLFCLKRASLHSDVLAAKLPLCGSMPRWRSSGWVSSEHQFGQAWSAYPSRSGWRETSLRKEGADDRPAHDSASVWYFGFGANINPWKLRERRGIIPLAEFPGKLPGWRLLFNHKGGMGNIERLDAADDGPDAVHGILLQLSARDFNKLCQMEYEYRTVQINVESYDGRVISAQAFVSPPEWKLPTNVAPPERYLKLIRDGCKEMGIDMSYQDWLNSIASNRGRRGSEYWDAPANNKKKARSTSPVQKEGPLKIGALSAFAVDGLVDIGANLNKCSSQDLASQLLRASAAKVGHVILTGCSLVAYVACFCCQASCIGSFGLQLMAVADGNSPSEAVSRDRRTRAAFARNGLGRPDGYMP